MNNLCPNCGAERQSDGTTYRDEWKCGSGGWDGVVCQQFDKCLIACLRAENERLREDVAKLLEDMRQPFVDCIELIAIAAIDKRRKS